MTEDRRFTDPFKEDLHRLVENVSAMRSSLAKIEEKMEKVEDHHRTLYGINGSPGLTIVVDRLDQVEKSRSKHLTIIYTALTGLGIDVILKYLNGRH